ncbi:MAG: serine/threonine protein kinase, partial [Armatimonadetes bacterium]|nr:serine/threonine protein kinase [Armatimonadota bacterium]
MELEQIGKYTILDRLSSGKTANAYRAVDPTANRLVFLKILNIPEGISPLERHSLVDHFYGEARSAGGLTHPNLVTLYEIGEDLGRHYIAMEFLEGVSVRRLLDEQGRLPMDQAVEIARCVCQALVYAHKKGVIHRDVKPDNIVVMEEMAVKLTDFGIARVEGDIRRTQVGIILGSPAYMSPEQIKGAAIDARTDIFSLGVCLYEMLSGRKPFDAPSATAVMQAIVKDPPRPLEDAPESLQNILRKAMAKDPAYRYPGAAEMLADLKAFRPDGILLPEPPEGLPAGAEEAVERTLQPTLAPQEIAELRESLLTPPPHTRRFSWVGALFAVVLLAITAAGAYLYARLNPPPGPAQASENRPFAAYARPIPPA